MIRTAFVLALALMQFSVGAESLLVNLAPDSPLFNLKSEAGTVSRSLAPGSRLVLEPGRLLAQGTPSILLERGRVYYWARLNGPDRLYQIDDNQALVINASGLALDVAIQGSSTARGLLANGSFLLGEVDGSGLLHLEWHGQGAEIWSSELEGGRLYRLELGSPDGIGIQPILVSWDDLDL